MGNISIGSLLLQKHKENPGFDSLYQFLFSVVLEGRTLDVYIISGKHGTYVDEYLMNGINMDRYIIAQPKDNFINIL